LGGKGASRSRENVRTRNPKESTTCQKNQKTARPAQKKRRKKREKPCRTGQRDHPGATVQKKRKTPVRTAGEDNVRRREKPVFKKKNSTNAWRERSRANGKEKKKGPRSLHDGGNQKKQKPFTVRPEKKLVQGGKEKEEHRIPAEGGDLHTARKVQRPDKGFLRPKEGGGQDRGKRGKTSHCPPRKKKARLRKNRLKKRRFGKKKKSQGPHPRTPEGRGSFFGETHRRQGKKKKKAEAKEKKRSHGRTSPFFEKGKDPGESRKKGKKKRTLR